MEEKEHQADVCGVNPLLVRSGQRNAKTKARAAGLFETECIDSLSISPMA